MSGSMKINLMFVIAHAYGQTTPSHAPVLYTFHRQRTINALYQLLFRPEADKSKPLPLCALQCPE